MNAKTFLSACLLSLTALGCQPTPLPQEEACPIEEPAVILPHIPPLAALPAPASAPTPAPVEVTPLPPAMTPTMTDSELRLVSPLNEKPLLILQDGADLTAKGKASWASKLDHAVRREVDLASLPESTAAWLGQAVKLYKEDGSFCEAKVTQLSLFGWVNVYDDNPDRNSASKMFKLSQQRRGVRLAAELDIDSCKGALFGRLASLPTPEIAFPQEADKTLRKAALTQMRALSTYKTVQRRYQEHLAAYPEETPTKVKRWEYLYEATPRVMTLQTKTRTIVLASAQQDNGCGDFYGSLFALWELKSDGALVLLYQSEASITPEFAFDIDGDQTLEFFQNDSWLQLKNGEYQLMDEFSIPFEEDVCGC